MKHEIQAGALPPTPSKEGVIARPIRGGIIELPATQLFTDRLPKVEKLSGKHWVDPEKESAFVDDPTYAGKSDESVSLFRRISGIKSFDLVLSSGTIIARKVLIPHGRSINVMYPDAAEEIIIAGQRYSGISAKGADFTDVRLVKDRDNIHGFHINGLMTSDTADSLVTNSEYLRQKGITSEVIWGVSRLDKLPILERNADGKLEYRLVEPSEYKEWLLQKAEEENKKLPRDERIDIAAARRHLASVDFVVINRATTVPFRWSDLYLPFQVSGHYGTSKTANEDFVFMMNHMFSYLNRDREKDEQFSDLVNVDPYFSDDWQNKIKHNQESAGKFFDYFAHNLGTQLGSLHKAGVSHTFLHGGNLVADGGFNDLDSLRKNASAKSMLRDIGSVLKNIFIAGEDLQPNHLVGKAGFMKEGQSIEVAKAFLQQYLVTRFGEKKRGMYKKMLEAYLLTLVGGRMVKNIFRRPDPTSSGASLKSYSSWIHQVLTG